MRLVGVAIAWAAVLAGAATAAVPPAQQISVDPFTDALGQHETAVEPDSFSFGDTVVAVFQVGRIVSGGASGIGWATSTDGGQTWRSGVLPALTAHGDPAGPLTRVSDPVIAYDRVHGVWLASVLGIREDPVLGLVSSLVTSRSTDGLIWSAPIVTSPEFGAFVHDKNWIVCDNGATSPRAGTCYITYTSGSALRVLVSADGGVTWFDPVRGFTHARGSGWQPVVQPDGTLVVVYEGDLAIEAVRSTDGARDFSTPVVVGELRTAPVPGMRAPALPSVEVDATGTIVAAWHDCRFRAGCSFNDIVYGTSTDGVRWSRVRRVPTARALNGLTHFVPGLAVDTTSRGASRRLAVAFYVLTRAGAVQPFFVSSADTGRSWSAVEALAPAQPPDAYPNSNSGRFAGDYISTTFVGSGTAVPVFAAASAPPFDGRFHQGVFASAIPPLPMVTRPLALGPVRVTRTRTRLSASAALSGGVFSPIVTCRLRGVRGRVVSARVFGGRAICVWRVNSRARASGTIAVTTPEGETSRSFAVARGRWAAEAKGNYRTLVILATWGPEPFARDDVRRVVFEESDALYRRSSFGQVSLSGDVTPWLRAFSFEPACPTPEHERIAPALAEPMQNAARAAGYDPDAYARLVYVHPRMPCQWQAIGVRREVLLNGVLSAWTVVHELGHTFGLAHAYARACDASGCRHDEYGDPFSPMGRGFVDFSAYEKVKLGWIPSIGPTQSRGRHLIGRPDSATATPHAFVVRTGAGDYWLEQRLDVTPPGLAVRRVEPDIPDDDLEAPTRFVRNDNNRAGDVTQAGGTFDVPGVFRVAYEPSADGNAVIEFAWTDHTPPPAPTILAPGRRVRTGRPIRIVWRPSREPASGVWSCTVSVDWRVISSGDGTTITVPAFRRGRHTIAVRCTDRAGNRGPQATRMVTAR